MCLICIYVSYTYICVCVTQIMKILLFLFMKEKKRKQLILSLIKDDLINSKLVNSLTDMGLDGADSYLLHLSSTIFKLIGFDESKETDSIFEYYLELTLRAKHIPIFNSRAQFDELALEIYNELLLRKPLRS
jgi:hypothetical protein